MEKMWRSAVSMESALSKAVLARDEAGLRALLGRRGEAGGEGHYSQADMAKAAEWANNQGQVGCLAALLEGGLDVAAPSREGGKMVFMAACGGDAECLKTLIEAGAGLEWDAQLSTAAHVAAGEGSEECLELLIRAGARLDGHDGLHRAPMHRAAMEGREGCVRLLLGAGVDVGILDGRSWTAEQLAREHARDRVADLIAAEPARREAMRIGEATGPGGPCDRLSRL